MQHKEITISKRKYSLLGAESSADEELLRRIFGCAVWRGAGRFQPSLVSDGIAALFPSSVTESN